MLQLRQSIIGLLKNHSLRRHHSAPLETPIPVISPNPTPTRLPDNKSSIFCIEEKEEERRMLRFICRRNFFLDKGRNATEKEQIELFIKHGLLTGSELKK